MARARIVLAGCTALALAGAAAAMLGGTSRAEADAKCLDAFRRGGAGDACAAARADGSPVAAFLEAASGAASEGLDAAAEAGLAPALAVRALPVLRSVDSTAAARKAALGDLRTAAHAGYAPAQLWLGVALLSGEDGEGREGEAAEWLSRAARQGSADAQFLHAGLHRTGRGVVADRQRMRDLYLEAAQRGHAGAAYNLAADLYTRGEMVRAEAWLKRSAAGGFGPALAALARLSETKGEAEAAVVYHRLAAAFSFGVEAEAARAAADRLAPALDAAARTRSAERAAALETAIRAEGN